ncbi:albumin-2-like [Vigna radiata]|uniref:Albumin-2-like n=1 Tax=Vigna radiata var. radiata TaxID=3916 RepID=Q43680_VIGRR|nr:albumin-2-like [Vigna radiata]CAA50008.1 mung bean seed albumin [Vigna radiata var. radiata]
MSNLPYINAAFRFSSRDYEVYFFAKNKYVRLQYTPGKTEDKILTNLRLISSGFPSLAGTPFAEPGIDSAFHTEASEAYVFSANNRAYIDYAPGTTNDKILAGPTTIAEMFPVLRNTVFADSIDSAFRSTKGKEVYLFKGNKYVRIDYDSKQLVGSIRNISDGFPVLNGTGFESGIDASFASHKEPEAYLFKGDKYVRIHFTPGKTDDTLVGDVRPILDGWPVLKAFCLCELNKPSLSCINHLSLVTINKAFISNVCLFFFNVTLGLEACFLS